MRSVSRLVRVGLPLLVLGAAVSCGSLGDPRFQPQRDKPSVTKAQCEAGGGRPVRDGSPAGGSSITFCLDGTYGRRVVRH
ncbi:MULTISPECIES: hypothetical protein [Thermomonosporaceae]|uniref:hypothetical protein n=1 Tax=Thermomonosporaceae TaxID=2012 RepID=UPI00255AA209|nr:MULTISPECIES: hypothetical protein [Thermomonosporaceae]MDL4777419.1 hypothetical protein [Actinomadura xylanilytica]